MPQAQGIQGVAISDTLSQTHSYCSFSNDTVEFGPLSFQKYRTIGMLGEEAIFPLLPQAG